MFSVQRLINVGVANVIATALEPIKSTSINRESIKSIKPEDFFPGHPEGCKPMMLKTFETDPVYCVPCVYLDMDSQSSLDHLNRPTQEK